MKRHGLQGLLVLAIVLLTAFLAAPQAWADEAAPINHWNVDVNLSLDGGAHVNADLHHRSAHQHVNIAVRKPLHDRCFFLWRQFTV